jgi:hypothetical protein
MTTYNEIEIWLALKANNLSEFVESYADQFPDISNEQFVTRIVHLWKGKSLFNQRITRVKNKYDSCKIGRMVALGNGRKTIK